MPETNAIQAAYERFKLEWMLAHGYTLKNLIDELEQLRKESPELSLESIFHDWEFEYGFNTEIWPCFEEFLATVYKGNIIKNLIMDCQSYTKYRPNETTGGIFVSWRRKEELPTGA